MADDPWADFRAKADTAPSRADPWASFRAKPQDQGSVLDAAGHAAGQVVAPITDIPGEYSKEVHAAIQSMREGYNRLTGRDESLGQRAAGAGQAAMGALSYVTAPLNAPVHAIAGKPVGHAVTAATGSERAGEFAGDLADIAGGGLVGGGVTRGAARAGEAIDAALARKAAAKESGLSKPARDVIDQAIRSESGQLTGANPAVLQTNPDAMLVDVHPSLGNLLDTALQKSGPSAAVGRQAVEHRAAGSERQLTSALDATLGQPAATGAVERGLRQGTAAAREAAYTHAYETPVDYSSEQGRHLEDLVINRVPGHAIREANGMMRLEGEQSNQIMARIDDEGNVTYERMPDVRQLDYITRALNDAAYSSEGQGAMGGMTARQRAYSNLSGEIRDTLGEVVPEYRAALDTGAQPIQARRALDFGSEALKPNVSRDEVAYRYSRMTEPERQFARAGMRYYLDEIVANVKRTITDPNIDARQGMAIIKDLSSDAALEKMSVFLPPRQMRALQDAMDRATSALELRAAVSQNSKTAMRLMADNTVKEAAAPGPIKKLAQGKPLLAAKSVAEHTAGRILKATPADIRRKEEAIYAEIVRALTSREPEASRILANIKASYADPKQNGFLSGEIGAPEKTGGVLGASGGAAHSLSASGPSLTIMPLSEYQRQQEADRR
jgi:hypothetical protein